MLHVHAGESQSKRTFKEIKDKKMCEYAQTKNLLYNYKKKICGVSLQSFSSLSEPTFSIGI